MKATYTKTPLEKGLSQSTPISANSIEAQGNDSQINTEEILNTTIVPINDPIAMAEKYQGIADIPHKLSSPPPLIINGDTKNFWVLDVDNNFYRDVQAILQYQTDHVYFWIEDGVDFNYSELKKLVDRFENQIYPTNRQIFGSEWSPGVDNDPHLSILYAHNLGGAAGYFSSADSLMREVEKYSNVAEMFYLSADYISLNESFALGVLAHEFQHMIHWNIDRNESSWINEGLSELAVDLNGLDTGGFSILFAYDPDLQLNFWPGHDQGSSTPHYGASYLFMKYLLERFGEGFISSLIAQPENGLDGLGETLKSIDEYFPSNPPGSEQIFQDWSIANILQTDKIDEGIYKYESDIDIPSFLPIRTIHCGDNTENFSVNQFAADYYEIICDGDYKISIKWDSNVRLNSVDPFSGSHYFWSNSGDESAMRLSREFDLTDVDGDAELSFKAWFDIERDYDYAYLNISTDGVNWENLEPSYCIKENPTGANRGCGYNGMSEGWIEETVDLTKYIGQKVIVEFEYITDAAVNGEGLLIDDMRLDAINYFDDFEDDDSGWKSEGFARIQNTLPQVMGVSIIGTRDELIVMKHILKTNTEFVEIIQQNQSEQPALIVISGLSRYTHIPAQYQVTINKLDR